MSWLRKVQQYLSKLADLPHQTRLAIAKHKHDDKQIRGS